MMLWSCIGVKELESERCSVVSNSLWPYGLYSPWNSPGQNTEVGSLSLVQGIFSTQGSNPGLRIAGGFFTNWAIRETPKELEEILRETYMNIENASWIFRCKILNANVKIVLRWKIP